MADLHGFMNVTRQEAERRPVCLLYTSDAADE